VKIPIMSDQGPSSVSTNTGSLAASGGSSKGGLPIIKYFGVARMADKLFLYSESSDYSNQESYASEARILLEKLEQVSLLADERQKVTGKTGYWYSTCDSKNIYYLVLTEPTYPERHAYGFINEVQMELFKLPNYFMASDSEVSGYTGGFVPGIFRKYNDLRNLDKLWAAQNTVEEISTKMQQNMSQTLQNRENLENLDKKSAKLRNLGQDFYHNAEDMDKVQKERNAKMMRLVIIVLGVLITAVAVINFI